MHFPVDKVKPAPPTSQQLTQCYECGKLFPIEQTQRREVRMGTTEGGIGGIMLFHGHIGLAGGRSSGKITGIQTLCPQCASDHDEKKLQLKARQEAYDRQTWRFIIILICFVGGLILIGIVNAVIGHSK
jgi:hypothetical protein